MVASLVRCLPVAIALGLLIGCSRPCNPVEGTWTGEFWGDELEGTLELGFSTDSEDRSLAHIDGVWQDNAAPEAGENLSGTYSCPGDGAILGLFIEGEVEAEGGSQQVWGQLYGAFGTNREGDGQWEADVWAGDRLVGQYDGDWTARRN